MTEPVSVPDGLGPLLDRARSQATCRRGLMGRLREAMHVRVLLRSPLFDAPWYAARTDLPEGTPPARAARHYLREGAFLGLDPGPAFVTLNYYLANRDVAEEGHPALLHYLRYGRREGRELRTAVPNGALASPRGSARSIPPAVELSAFDPGWYLQTNEDVRRSGQDPRSHFERHGWAEGRQGSPLEALVLDRILWRGLERRALHDLRQLTVSGPPRERAVSTWALARWHACEGDWSACRAALEAHARDADSQGILPPDGAVHLGIRAALALHDISAARASAAELRNDRSADTALSRMTIALASDRGLASANADLAALSDAAGISRLRIVAGDDPAFARLTADPPPRVSEEGPMVSVIVPCRDTAETIGQALDGLRRQSWTALDIIVVDDGSTDESAAIVEKAAQNDARIRLLRRARSDGAYVARNAGLAVARGAFITVHDADDWSHPEKIERQLRALQRHPGAVATISHWVRVDADLAMVRWRYDDGWTHRNTSSLMFAADLRDRLGFWDRVAASADTEYMHRIVAVHGAAAVVDVLPGVPLSFGRSGTGNLSSRSAIHARSLLHGPRRSYLDSAAQWHAAARERGDLHLPERPATRAFWAPAALRPIDPYGTLTDYERIATSELFDAAWYREANADVRERDPDPVAHYLAHGGREGRDPGPGFSSTAWRHASGLGEGECPLLHYERHGRAQGQGPLPRFSGCTEQPDPATAIGTALFCLHAAGPQVFGAERSALTAMERLAAEGWRLVTIMPTLGNLAYFEEVRRRSATVEVLPQLWRHAARPPRPESVQLLRDAIRRHSADVVHVNTITIDAPLAAARAEGCRPVLHVRELPAEDPDLCRTLGVGDPDALHRTLLEEADAFVANSPRVARWLDCPERTEIWPVAIDPRLFDLPAAPRDPLRVGLVGSNGARKGVADFMAVAQAVAEQGGRARFVLVGPVSEAAERLRPWPGNVEAVGYRIDPVQAMAEVDVVLSLSKFAESFGRTVLEAMAAGRPVIAYRRGTPADLVQDGVTGFLVEQNNPRAVVEGVLKIEQSIALLENLIVASRRAAKERSDHLPNIRAWQGVGTSVQG